MEPQGWKTVLPPLLTKRNATSSHNELVTDRLEALPDRSRQVECLIAGFADRVAERDQMVPVLPRLARNHRRVERKSADTGRH